MILPLKKQVCSPELAEKLKELGAPQETLNFWYKNFQHKVWILAGVHPSEGEWCAAYTVAELGELLRNGRVPMSISREEDKLRRWLCTSYRTNISTTFNADTEADARALCLIDALEGDTPEKIKERKAFLKYFLKLCI